MMAATDNTCMACSRVFATSRAVSNHLVLSSECQATSRNSFSSHSFTGRARSRSTTTSGSHTEELESSYDDRSELEVVDLPNQGEYDEVDEGSRNGAGEVPVDIPQQGGPEDETMMDDGEEDETDTDNCRSGFESPAHTNEDFIDALLLSLCERIGAPLYAFDLILEWASYASLMNYDFLFRARPRRKRKTVVSMLCKRYEMEDLRPQTCVVQVDYATLDDVMRIVKTDFVASIKNMLVDPVLMDPENLVVNKDSPFSKYVSPGGVLNEFQSGKAYQRAYDSCITETDQFLLALGMYNDKTGCDLRQRFGLDPLRWVPLIFKTALRNHHSSWRTIGYIYDLFNHSSAENSSRTVSTVILC
jgi:hypothetical protein